MTDSTAGRMDRVAPAGYVGFQNGAVNGGFTDREIWLRNLGSVRSFHLGGMDLTTEGLVNQEPPVSDGPVEPPVAEILQRVETRLGSIDERLAERAAARESIIERLHEENQRLRSGELQLMLRPILVDLQRLRNELLAGVGTRELSPAQVAELLGSFASSVELTLERGGVQVLRPPVGAPFDPAVHQVVGVVAVADPTGDGLLAEVLGDGYLDTVSGRALAPARVRVGRWTDPAATAGPVPAGAQPGPAEAWSQPGETSH
jgi:molecular chaperone GrpE